MAKLHTVSHDEVEFYCPGCRKAHRISTRIWTWNRSVETPTFTPGFLLYVGNDCCHVFIIDGELQYQTDSTHKLAGQRVSMPEWREDVHGKESEVQA